MKTKSQRQEILQHMRDHGHITPMTALERFGCYRLAARIHELRNQGFVIRTKTEHAGNEKYATYILRHEPPPS